MSRLHALWSGVAGLAIVGLIAATLIGLEPTARVSPVASPAAPAASIFTPVDSAVVDALADAETADVVLLADEPARADPRFAALVQGMDHSGSIYSGALAAEDLALAQSIPGLKVSHDVPVTVSDDVEPENSMYSELYDTPMTVPEVDPALAVARTQLGLQGAGQVIAIVDTGVDTKALGLSGKVTHRVDFSQPTAACSDNGYLDPAGHGTQVASIAAGAVSASNRGIAGVAPQAKLIDLRVFNCDEGGTTAEVDLALQWILDNRAARSISVVNLSLTTNAADQSGTDTTSILVNRLVAAGVVVVAGAGNSGDAASTIRSPGTALFATTVGSANVSAYGSGLSTFSSQGPTPAGVGIDLLAAGSSIISASTTAIWTGGTATSSGTSLAAPYISGLAALLRQKSPGQVPSGVSCVVGPGCALGVYDWSMNDPVSAAMKTSDWFAPGPDPVSGAGLIDAAATLRGVAAPAATTLVAQLDNASPHYLEVPPHSEPVVIAMATDLSIPESAWSGGKLEYQWFDSLGESSGVEIPCSMSVTVYSVSCNSLSLSFTSRVWNFSSPPTSETTWLSLTSGRTVTASFTAAGLDAPLSLSTGVAAEDLALDAEGHGTLSVVRTAPSDSATSIAIASSSGLEVAPTTSLPAGAAGTTVEVPVEVASDWVPDSFGASARITLATQGSLVGVVSVQLPPAGSGSGRLTVNGAQLRVGELGSAGVTTSGAVIGISMNDALARAPHSSQGYKPGPFVVPAGSNNAERIELTQDTPTYIDMTSASDDGRVLLLGAPGVSSGLVPGDDDDRYIYFAHDRISGDSWEIGSSAIAPIQGTYGWPVLNSIGNAAAFLANVDGVQRLYWQGGDDFAESRALADFEVNQNVAVRAVSSSHVLIESWDPSVSTYRSTLFSIDGGAPLDLGQIDQGGAQMSEDGSAIATLSRVLPQITCTIVGSGQTVTFSTGGMGSFGAPRVGNDCAWVIGAFERVKAFPRGDLGMNLTRIEADGTREILATSAPSSQEFQWSMDASGTHFLTSTGMALEPGDTNGGTDFYRGIHGSRTLALPAAPAVIGTAAVGSPLAATVGEYGPAPVKLSYQWKRGGTAIRGATTLQYTPGAADIGFQLTLTVTAKKTSYLTESQSSTPTARVVGVGTAMKAPIPTVTGSALPGIVLKGKAGAWTPGNATLSYRWERNGVEIPGATALNYTVVEGDRGSALTLTVTGNRTGYATTFRTSAAKIIPRSFEAVGNAIISGNPRVGAVLIATAVSTPSATAASFQWYRNGYVIAKATKSSYTVTTADAGKNLTVTIGLKRDGYESRLAWSEDFTIEKRFTSTPTPTLSGTPEVGKKLTAKVGTWKPTSTLSFAWKRGGTPIEGATATSYTLTTDDAGQSITFSVTADRLEYTTTTKTSKALAVKKLLTATPTPDVTGTPAVGATLTAAAGTWEPASVTKKYQWKRNGASIAKATKSTYKLTSSDAGKTITLVVTGSRSGYSTVAKTSAGLVVGKVLTKTPVPTVTGVLAVGQTLTAATGAWSPATVTFGYQWRRDGLAIEGATGSTYELVAADAGRLITVTVTGSLELYTSVAKTSAAKRVAL